jgi:hypothetical protein
MSMPQATLGSDEYNELVTIGYISEGLFNLEELGHEVTQFENSHWGHLHLLFQCDDGVHLEVIELLFGHEDKHKVLVIIFLLKNLLWNQQTPVFVCRVYHLPDLVPLLILAHYWHSQKLEVPEVSSKLFLISLGYCATEANHCSPFFQQGRNIQGLPRLLLLAGPFKLKAEIGKHVVNLVDQNNCI